jgi:hypothetical protein
MGEEVMVRLGSLYIFAFFFIDFFWGICVFTPTLKWNCDFALIFFNFVILPFTIHKSLRFYPPLVNGQNRGKYAKIKGKIATTCEE